MAEYMKPIIELVEKDLRIQQENNIMKAVHEAGVHVDKDRLIRALSDAGSYWQEGYNQGYQDGAHIVRCHECIHRYEGTRPYCHGRLPDWFCADGLRRFDACNIE